MDISVPGVKLSTSMNWQKPKVLLKSHLSSWDFSAEKSLMTTELTE